MTEPDPEQMALRKRLMTLRTEHADLGVAIVAIEEMQVPDRLALRRLKKRKLALKDQITVIASNLTPDIIA